MMKTVLIMRHAKSSWGNATLTDHERPLNPRGYRNAQQMGVRLKQAGLLPDLILTSTAKRAWQTAENLGDLGDIPTEQVGRLYHATADIYLDVLRRVGEPHRIVLIIGHNPGISDFLDELTDTHQRMKTANIAHVHLPLEHWAALDETVRGELGAFWQPQDTP